MKCFAFVPSLVVLLILSSAARAGERSVVVPDDTTPFTVTQKDVVRLTGTAIAGGNVTAKVDGPAKIESENTVTELDKGKRPIGMLKKEFEIKPTGKGTVKVTLTITSPIPGKPLKKITYEFKVE